jgi:hypothetical protein
LISVLKSSGKNLFNGTSSLMTPKTFSCLPLTLIILSWTCLDEEDDSTELPECVDEGWLATLDLLTRFAPVAALHMVMEKAI